VKFLSWLIGYDLGKEDNCILRPEYSDNDDDDDDDDNDGDENAPTSQTEQDRQDRTTVRQHKASRFTIGRQKCWNWKRCTCIQYKHYKYMYRRRR